MATRSCGYQTVELHERGWTITWEDLPQRMAASAAFCLAMKAKAEALLLVSEISGTVLMRRDEGHNQLQLKVTVDDI
jgi:hypothetical protein